jgi:hypothetical protein
VSALLPRGSSWSISVHGHDVVPDTVVSVRVFVEGGLEYEEQIEISAGEVWVPGRIDIDADGHGRVVDDDIDVDATGDCFLPTGESVVQFPLAPVAANDLIVQLTWADEGDLDLRVSTGGDPIDWCNSLDVDVDDTTGFGPENIAIAGIQHDGLFVSVHALPRATPTVATVSVFLDLQLVAELRRTLAGGERWAPLRLSADNGEVTLTRLFETLSPEGSCFGDTPTP